MFRDGVPARGSRRDGGDGALRGEAEVETREVRAKFQVASVPVKRRARPVAAGVDRRGTERRLQGREGGEELRRGERGDPREDPRRRRRLRAALLEARHQQREQPGQGAADAEGHLLRRQERVSTRVCSAHARRGV